MKKVLAVGLASVAMAASLNCTGAPPNPPTGLANDAARAASPGLNSSPVGTPNPRPAARTLQFSGYDWVVKSSDHTVGPGPNYFSDGDDNVAVDEQGRLHLRITQRDGRWYCAEVVSARSFGYGIYRFYLDTAADDLDAQVVLGMFTWSDDPAYNHRELDIEISRWGKADDKNAQFVVQPYTRPQNIVRFQIPSGLQPSTHSFTWKPGEVFCQSLKGRSTALPDLASVIEQHGFTQGVPRAGGENARINLWLLAGHPPADGKEAEVIISKFEFVK